MTNRNIAFGNKLTKEDCITNGRKGGIKSGKVRREKKKMRDLANTILSMPIEIGKLKSVEDIKNFFETDNQNITVQEAMIIAQIKKALSGDTKAFEIIRDTSGQKPTDKINAKIENVSNPFEGLTSEELRKIIEDGKGAD